MSSPVPGLESGRLLQPREILFANEGSIRIPIAVDGVLGMDGGNTPTFELRPGWLMARISATGRWVPCKRTVALSAGSNATQVDVENANAFRVGDTIKLGESAAVAVSAIDYASHRLTLAAARTWLDADEVYTIDGSQTCRGILADWVSLVAGDGVTPAHHLAGVWIQGAVRVPLLLGDVTAIRNDPAAKLLGFRFSDEHGV